MLLVLSHFLSFLSVSVTSAVAAATAVAAAVLFAELDSTTYMHVQALSVPFRLTHRRVDG